MSDSATPRGAPARVTAAAGPRFSILVSGSDAHARSPRETLDSVRAQTFPGWELNLVETRGGAAVALNAALADSAGEFVVILEPGDRLASGALAALDRALRGNVGADLAYSDEDLIDGAGGRSEPFFKPDFSPERLRTQMYLGRLSAVRREAIGALGGFDPALEGAHEWDMALKVTERNDAVVHVPQVLCHRPVPSAVDADAGARAVAAHCARVGLQARVESDPDRAGINHLKPALERRPPVSILIPTGGRSRTVRGEETVLATHCVRSIVEASSYDAYEIVCVADASVGDEILGELREAGGERLRIVEFDAPFNFSAKINLGAHSSEGEHLLLLNDDMEVVSPDWIERLLMYSALPGIGAVGARLLWEDGRIQHAGIVFEDGLPGHVYRGSTAGSSGYRSSALTAQNYLAVTAACLMTPRQAFEEVGGFDEALPVSYNDVDYCLKLGTAGGRVVYDPDTLLHHFESSSRSGKVARAERRMLLDRWRAVPDPDPFSNPGLRYGVPRTRSPKAWLSTLRRRWLR